MTKQEIIDRITRAEYYVEDVYEDHFDPILLNYALDVLFELKEELKAEIAAEENEV